MSSRPDDERFTMLQHSAADFGNGVRVTEINRHAATFYRWLDRIAEIALRGDLNRRIGLREFDNGFPHAPSCANKQHSHGR